MKRPIFAATIFAILGASLTAAVAAGKMPVREYKSMWDPDPGSEHMWLAEDFASFSDMRGHLVLAYAGMMPPENDEPAVILTPGAPIIVTFELVKTVAADTTALLLSTT